MITLGIVRGVHVSVWKVSDLFNVLAIFHTWIGGTFYHFCRSPQNVGRWNLENSLVWRLGACSHLLRPFSPQPGLGRVLAVLPALNAGGRSVPWYNPICRLLRVLLYFSTRLWHHDQDVNKSERVWKHFCSCCLTQTADRSHMYELDHHSLQVVF